MLKIFFLLCIKAYQYLMSPFLGNNCRFEPSCSAYAYQAIQNHGCIKGTSLSIKRICSCHPWGSFGYDPVPTEKKS